MHGQGETFDDTDAVGDLQGLKVPPQALHGGTPLAPHTVDAFAKQALARLAAKKLLLAVSAKHVVTAASAPIHAAAAALILPHDAAAAAAHGREITLALPSRARATRPATLSPGRDLGKGVKE